MTSFRLEAKSRALNSEKAAKFCGWARVSTSSLVFYPDFTPADIRSQPEKVERLKRIFKQEGCDRENASYDIPGDITAATLSAALDHSEVSREKLQDIVKRGRGRSPLRPGEWHGLYTLYRSPYHHPSGRDIRDDDWLK